MRNIFNTTNSGIDWNLQYQDSYYRGEGGGEGRGGDGGGGGREALGNVKPQMKVDFLEIMRH